MKEKREMYLISCPSTSSINKYNMVFNRSSNNFKMPCTASIDSSPAGMELVMRSSMEPMLSWVAGTIMWIP